MLDQVTYILFCLKLPFTIDVGILLLSALDTWTINKEQAP